MLWSPLLLLHSCCVRTPRSHPTYGTHSDLNAAATDPGDKLSQFVDDNASPGLMHKRPSYFDPVSRTLDP